ncbi:MAG: hypothetical protein FWC20_09205 [Oscillospiraceae bacterium]|nr:hypothetical protein [Oscillospiraceae bacterium]MCL2279567.1 hypothetical protein [Oscillospiraceae bacterium]
MNLLNTPCVIALSGKENSGKSTALIRLINRFITSEHYDVFSLDYKSHLFNTYPCTVKIAETRTPKKKNGDYSVPSALVYVDFPSGLRCGINTVGDTGEHVRKDLKILDEQAKCDIFITAARSQGVTIEATKDFAKCKDIPLLTLSRTSGYFSDMNIDEFLFDLLSSEKL